MSNYWNLRRDELRRRLEKFNPYHDERGRFTSADRAVTVSGDKAPMGRIGIPEEIALGAVSKFTDDGNQSFIDGLAENGRFTTERQRLHDKIVASYVDGIPESEDPTFTMMGGGTASGKGTFGRAGLIPGIEWNDTPGEGDYVHIDSDEIKKALVKELGIDRKDWAAFTHEESSYLAKRIMDAAVNRRQDYLLDGTGDGSVNSVRKKVAKAAEAGYKTQAFYVTVPIETAIEREAVRAQKSGRKVPAGTTIATHQDVSRVFPEVVDSKLFSSVRLFDTSGGSPRLVFSDVNTPDNDPAPTIHDEGAYRGFLSKSRMDVDALTSYANSIDVAVRAGFTGTDTNIEVSGTGRVDGDGDGYAGEDEAAGTMGVFVGKADDEGPKPDYVYDDNVPPNVEQINRLTARAISGGMEAMPDWLGPKYQRLYKELVREVEEIRAKGYEPVIGQD